MLKKVYYTARDVYIRFRDIKYVVHILREYQGTSFFAGLIRALHLSFWPDTPRILFWPQRTSYRYSAYKLCVLCGYRVSVNPSAKTKVYFWRYDDTYSDTSKHLLPGMHDENTINFLCTDISKKRVGVLFKDVFGYSLDVNPLTYNGEMVEKSNLNATHDGKIIKGPITREQVNDGNVYQKSINNLNEDATRVVIYRVPVLCGSIPVVYTKYRPLNRRFSGSYDRVEWNVPDEIFSAEEIEKLKEMAERFQADFCEMDVLRDKDGRIYVIDVNNTPSGPPHQMSEEQKRAVRPLLTASFNELVNRFAENRISRRREEAVFSATLKKN